MEIAYKNLMFDVANGVEIFDTELDRTMTKAEVDEKLKKIAFEMTGLNEKSTDKQIRRALQDPKCREYFAVIEEILDVKVEETLQGIDIFNKYVEEINLADGDVNEFWAEKETYLDVERVSGSHHDFDCWYRIRVA